MPNERGIPKSIVDQIVDELLAQLAAEEVFDEQCIEELRKLAAQNALKRATKVTQALKPDTRGDQ